VQNNALGLLLPVPSLPASITFTLTSMETRTIEDTVTVLATAYYLQIYDVTSYTFKNTRPTPTKM
jgi:hypothetical protein